MKLRSLSLGNVRKFAGQTATISGIGDGVTVVSEANEFGKSTFFDALHALFFLKYGAAAREVKSLQPRSGGAVRVSAEIELPSGRFTVEKSFLAQRRASVKDSSGTIIALDDEAESWIARLMDTGLEGPAGLLWVRQGVTALEPAGSTAQDKKNLLGARQNLLTSFAGEIDMITGGRRMDRVIEAASQALGRLATNSGKPVAHGPWRQAEQEAQAHTERHAELEHACSELSQALARRREVTARLAVLDAPQAHEALTQAVVRAQAAHDGAQAHADKLAQAQAQVTLRQLEQEAAQSKLDALIASAQQFEAAQATLVAARSALKEATEKMQAAEAATDGAQQAVTLTAKTLADATKAREAAQQGALRQNAVEKHAQLDAVLTQVQEKRAELELAKAALATHRVTDQALAGIEGAQAEVARAQADMASGGVQMQISYEGSRRIVAAGNALEEGAHRIGKQQVFELEGIGRMTLDPGLAAADTGVLERAQAALAAALTAIELPDVAAARVDAVQRRQLAAQVAHLSSVVDTLAPEGLSALQEAVAHAQSGLERLSEAADGPVADPAQLMRSVEAAQDADQLARAAYERARDGRDTARAGHAHSQAMMAAAQAGFDSAAAAYGTADDFAARQAQAARNHSAAQVAVEDAQVTAQKQQAAAPDLASATADLARAKSAAENAREERAQLTTRRADLNATIRTRAEDGVEEKRDEAAGLIQIASERAARFAHEAAGLKLLVDALRKKRGAAQEAYFGPVQQELAPLLALLHEDAALSFDPASMLPQGLARGGAEEQLDMLSGGTQEQIAILTRLAFARLFARQGKPMPIILDDALVYSDDNRITAMFTALHRVAADQQVIVFTCRQMAFAGLGGTRPQVDVVQDR